MLRKPITTPRTSHPPHPPYPKSWPRCSPCLNNSGRWCIASISRGSDIGRLPTSWAPEHGTVMSQLARRLCGVWVDEPIRSALNEDRGHRGASTPLQQRDCEQPGPTEDLRVPDRYGAPYTLSACLPHPAAGDTGERQRAAAPFRCSVFEAVMPRPVEDCCAARQSVIGQGPPR